MKTLALSLLSAAALALPAWAEINDAEGGAMKKLAYANLHEVEAGKLAASKAQSDEVRKFGQKMADDHGQMLKDLQKLATQKGVKLPDRVGAREEAGMLRLKALSGERFDRDYMADMVKDHEKDVRETQEMAATAQDPDFKKAVQEANAKIQEHLRLARQVTAGSQASSGGTSSTK